MSAVKELERKTSNEAAAQKSAVEEAKVQYSELIHRIACNSERKDDGELLTTLADLLLLTPASVEEDAELLRAVLQQRGRRGWIRGSTAPAWSPPSHELLEFQAKRATAAAGVRRCLCCRATEVEGMRRPDGIRAIEATAGRFVPARGEQNCPTGEAV